MKTDIILAGVGGQGVVTLARLLAAAGVRQGLNARESELHGMAQRGGAVHAQLRLAEAEIASPLTRHGRVDIIAALEPMEALRFLPRLSANGRVICDPIPVPVDDVKPKAEQLLAALRQAATLLPLPAGELARECGAPRAANIVMLGALAAATGLRDHCVAAVVRERFRPAGEAAVSAIMRACAAGRRAAEAGTAGAGGAGR
jgi:indolepyruvate ferredoxin oxidoreductase beta subunit